SDRIRDGVLEHALGGIESFQWHINFPELGPSVTVHQTERPSPITPGGYEDLQLLPRARAKLTAGTYHFNRLRIERDAVLEIHDSSGPVYLWVMNELKIFGTIRTVLLEPNVLVGYLGAGELLLSYPFLGTLVAPRATLVLGPADG